MMNNIGRKIQHFNSAIADSRKICKNKKYINYKSMNGLFLTVYTMALIFQTHSSSLEKEYKKIRCSDSMTCSKCTIEPMCVWSLKQQTCEKTNQYNSSSLIVSRIGECPKFRVVKKYDYEYTDNSRICVDYDVEITNDLLGFINYLNNADMYYAILNAFQEKVKITDKTKILCSFLQKKSSVNIKPAIIFIFIKFNDIMIQFDNVADHYVTVYGHKECATNEKYKNCVTCGWNTNKYSNYLKWCSSENTCNDDKSLYLKNNATNIIDEKVAYVANECAEINVTAVNPLSGPKTGGTTVRIIVRNHRIFLENRTLKVTVAGTVCTNPNTSGLDTITCTTSQAVDALSGPILVEYSSFESGLKIESSQIFKYCVDPVLDADQQLGGIASGGTSVPIHGRHFVEPCVISSAQLYVDLPNGVTRYAYNVCDPPVNDTYMVCQSPRMNGASWDSNQSVVGRLLNFGLNVLKFNGNQSLSVTGTSLSFHVHPDPVLEDFKECANDEKYKSCATCAWNKDGYSNYLRWCSSDNTCQVRKNMYMRNNGEEQLNLKLAHLTNDCSEINVTAVDPLSGPETGGTTMMITVRNHEILAENRTVIVTIAGTVCMNPRTLGPETITCTTTQSKKTLSGPIMVEYSSIESVLKIESSQIFQFCLNPVLDVAHQLGGIASGGTSVPVLGNNFVEPCFALLARLYVDLSDDVRRYSDSYCDPPVNDTYMVCRSPKVNCDSRDGDASVVGKLLNFGLEITFSNVDFSSNQSQPIVVRGPSLSFYVHPDPVLLDFKIDESGSVVVNGLHLQDLQPKDIVIRAMDSPSSVCLVISVIRDGLVCEPNMSVNAAQIISVTLGKSLLFTVSRRTLPHPDDPSEITGWFITVIVMSTVLVFVLALAYCLRKKNRAYVIENNISNLPESSTSSQDLYVQTIL
ncbi:uncharacterized protein LOC103309417 [Acyrthosiphon pisum]|uniref:IPT/TIG domain-containing protein n=1 Tax=Acyrthosiphon pisum TaxID=7029 RepID=A0A8R2NKW4_ACYPI|nr:uncharacterized protein LOC103309417 [Acyrthosiphon pisum]